MGKRIGPEQEPTIIMASEIDAALADSTPIETNDQEPLPIEPPRQIQPAVRRPEQNGLAKHEGNGSAIRKADVPIGTDGQLRPTSLEGLWRVAELYFASGMCPQGVDSVPKMFIALECGLAIGLSPSQALQNVMVVNNRPTIWGDAALAVVQASGLLVDINERIEGTGDNMAAICEAKRRDRESPVIRTFSVADAKLARLWGKSGPWTNYPKRMLQVRARTFTLRDLFPDFLRGVGIREEVDDYDDRTNGQQKAAELTNRLAGATQ